MITNVITKIDYIDESAMRSLKYSFACDLLPFNIVKGFLGSQNVTLKCPQECIEELSRNNFINNSSLFVSPPSTIIGGDTNCNSQTSTIDKDTDLHYVDNSNFVFFNEKGELSGHNFEFNYLGVKVVNQGTNYTIQNNYSGLSPQDQIIYYDATQDEKSATSYCIVGIFTNDYELRQKAKTNNKIYVHGSASMLAAMTLHKYLTYQKSTAVYEKWAKKDDKWVPKNPENKAILPFKDILAFEKSKIECGTSFWV